MVEEITMALTRQQWRSRTDWQTVCRRAAGRRKYNQWQKAMAAARQEEVFKLFLAYGFDRWGTLARIARILGCHRSTILRDRRALLGR
jgi:hypothetical protein